MSPLAGMTLKFQPSTFFIRPFDSLFGGLKHCCKKKDLTPAFKSLLEAGADRVVVRPEFVETEAERVAADRGTDPSRFSDRIAGYPDGWFTLDSGPAGATGKRSKLTRSRHLASID